MQTTSSACNFTFDLETEMTEANGCDDEVTKADDYGSVMEANDYGDYVRRGMKRRAEAQEQEKRAQFQTADEMWRASGRFWRGQASGKDLNLLRS